MQLPKSHFLDGTLHRLSLRPRRPSLGRQLSSEGRQRVTNKDIDALFEGARDHEIAHQGKGDQGDREQHGVP